MIAEGKEWNSGQGRLSNDTDKDRSSKESRIKQSKSKHDHDHDRELLTPEQDSESSVNDNEFQLVMPSILLKDKEYPSLHIFVSI